MPLYTYTCAEQHSHDALGAVQSPSWLDCPECGEPATRQSLYSVALVGEARTPLDQRQYNLKDFKEAGAELEHAHTKAESDAGRELDTPSLWRESQRRAKILKSKGVQDSSDFRGTNDGAVKYRTRWLGTELVKQRARDSVLA